MDGSRVNLGEAPQVHVLGPVRLSRAGTTVDVGSPKQRLVLAALVVAAGDVVSTDRLAELVWAGDPPTGARHNLQQYVSRLRCVLEPDRAAGEEPTLLRTVHSGYVLTGVVVDAHVAAADVAAARRSLEEERPDAAVDMLERTLGRWAGEPWTGLRGVPFIDADADRVDELELTARELLAAGLLGRGHAARAASELRRVVDRAPLREGARALLVDALAASGRRADALAAYRSARELLARELGIEPGPALQAAHLRALRDEHTGPVPASSTGAAPSGGPATGTATSAEQAVTAAPVERGPPPARWPMVDGPARMAMLRPLLDEARLLTLVGPGGIGKTRHALELAHELVADGRDVVWVELAAVPVDGQVHREVAATLGIDRPDPAQRNRALLHVLAGADQVLVLDNAEHVAAGVAGLVDTLLDALPRLAVVCTSRAPVGIAGERVVLVEALASDHAAELFLHRAAATTGRAVDADPALVRYVCDRLDGLPLAVELAAGRTGPLSVAELAEHLDDRFWLLRRRGTAATCGDGVRHSTLRATLDWSHDLLDEPDRVVLRAASTFAVDFDVAAVAAVADVDEQEVIDRLAVLVASSLVAIAPEGETTRYRLLETIRAYGRARADECGEAALLRERHARHLHARALTAGAVATHIAPYGSAGAGPPRSDGDVRLALRTLDDLGDRAAVGQLAGRAPLVLGLDGFVDADGLFLDREDVLHELSDAADRALYLVASAQRAIHVADYDRQLALGREAMAVAPDRLTWGAAAFVVANGLLTRDPASVESFVGDVLEAVPSGPSDHRALLTDQVGLAMMVTRRWDEAIAYWAGEPTDFGRGHHVALLHVLGRDEEAVAVPPPSLLLANQRDWRLMRPLARACAFAALGQPRAARDELAAGVGLGVGSRLGYLPEVARSALTACGAVHRAEGRLDEALAAIAVGRGRTLTPSMYVVHLHHRDALVDVLGNRAWDDARASLGRLDPHDELDRHLGMLGLPATADVVRGTAD